jgi:hypothetical protein
MPRVFYRTSNYTGGRIAMVFLAVSIPAVTGVAGNAQEVPSRMAAFFESSKCPEGWRTLEAAQGRLILGTVDPAMSGTTHGTPMTDGTAPTHRHSATVHLSTTADFGLLAAGCCNYTGAKPGSGPDSTGPTDDGAANLPFLQLPFCEK